MPHASIACQASSADPYAWLEQRDDAEVLAHLRAENAYLEAELAEQGPLREQLFEEIKAVSARQTCPCPRPGARGCTTSAPPPATNTRVTTAARARPMVR